MTQIVETKTTETDYVPTVNAELPSINADRDALHKRGEQDINFFASLAIPHVVTEPFPEFYVAIFHMLISRTPEQMGAILRFALGLPRGHAKTTFIKVLIAWLIVYDRVKFVLVICANDQLAHALVSDINDILGSSNIEKIYGRWTDNLTTDAKEQKVAHYHGHSVSIAAKGEGSAMRGINIKHARPDLVLFDDAQTKDCDESPVESAKFRRRFVATLKVIAPKGNRLIVYIGNMYSDTCMLYQLKTSKSWISFVTGAILENGEPLWPALHSLDSLLDGYLHDVELGEEEVWFAEVMNDPQHRGVSLIDGQVPVYDTNFGPVVPDGVFITIDPAGFRKKSDDNVIAIHFVYDGTASVYKVFAGNKNPEELIKETLDYAIEYGASLIAVESVAYQQTLLFWFNKYLTALGLQDIHVVPLTPKNRSKESRLLVFAKELVAGSYALHNAARAQVMWQLQKYKIGKKDNKDDIIDACAYGIDVRAEYWHLVTNLVLKRIMNNAKVIEANTPF